MHFIRMGEYGWDETVFPLFRRNWGSKLKELIWTAMGIRL